MKKTQLIILTLLIYPMVFFAQEVHVFGGSLVGNYGVTSAGINAGTSNYSSTFFGESAGQYSNGYANTFIGANAGRYSTNVSTNTFIGSCSGYFNQGTSNVFLGSNSGYYNKGSNNIFTGYQAGYKNQYGSSNVFSGYRAGYNNVYGGGNVFLGSNAGYSETSSNRLYIDNSSTTKPLIYGKFDSNQLGINTNIIPTGFALAVKGKVITEELKVQVYPWSDFVFEDTYYLPTLEEVENHIKQKGHLKDIPSAYEVGENGIFVGQMNAKLLQKIEELTLYTIQQQKDLEAQEQKNKSLEARLIALEKYLKN